MSNGENCAKCKLDADTDDEYEQSDDETEDLQKSAVYVPMLTVADFCKRYHLSTEISNILKNEGYQTAGALFEESDATLKDLGLKIGQVAELKRALKEFLSLEKSPVEP
ncbi:hypothetical protein C8R43DRAFT_1137958 [Mycena crocata]|nr:hypothetical protein C8R43DRAFT_1137958 [Mycena crocata]